jgi:hypothetical protein
VTLDGHRDSHHNLKVRDGATLQLTAAVSPAQAVGTFNVTDLSDGVSRSVATAPSRRHGRTTISITGLAQGIHSLTVTFTPSAGSSYAASSSTPLIITVVARPHGRDGDCHALEWFGTDTD